MLKTKFLIFPELQLSFYLSSTGLSNSKAQFLLIPKFLTI